MEIAILSAPARRWITTNRLLKKVLNVVLGSQTSSTGTRPPHQLGGAHRLGAPYSSHRAPQRVRLRCLLRLRPSCEAFLSSLGGEGVSALFCLDPRQLFSSLPTQPLWFTAQEVYDLLS
jgi:hypothetical protein